MFIKCYRRLNFVVDRQGNTIIVRSRCRFRKGKPGVGRRRDGGRVLGLELVFVNQARWGRWFGRGYFVL